MTEPHVLVVDDDLNICRMVSDALRMKAYRVTTASSVLEALEAVENQAPNLILLDIRMPILSGGDFAYVLRRNNRTVPVVVMTGEQDAPQWAEEIGAVGYLRKPFKLGDLYRLLETHLN
jgi:CheY-like chemotaxis protein